MDIEQTLKRLERKIDLLSRQKSKDRWVKVSVIMKATGWTSKDVRRFRENGLLEYRKQGVAMEYNINSVPPQLLLHVIAEYSMPS